jgi:hypothetical protein
MSTSPQSAPEPLPVVYNRWWRRFNNQGFALAEFNRALRLGELVATQQQEDMAPRELPTSYWRAARVVFDRDDPLTVVVVEGDKPAPGIFYVHEPAERMP